MLHNLCSLTAMLNNPRNNEWATHREIQVKGFISDKLFLSFCDGNEKSLFHTICEYCIKLFRLVLCTGNTSLFAFPSHPNWLCSTASLLFSGCWQFSQGGMWRGMKLTTTPSSANVKKWVEPYLHFHHTAHGIFRDNFTFMISPPSPSNFLSALVDTNWVFTSESVTFVDSNSHCWYFVFLSFFLSFLPSFFFPFVPWMLVPQISLYCRQYSVHEYQRCYVRFAVFWWWYLTTGWTGILNTS